MDMFLNPPVVLSISPLFICWARSEICGKSRVWNEDIQVQVLLYKLTQRQIQPQFIQKGKMMIACVIGLSQDQPQASFGRDDKYAVLPLMWLFLEGIQVSLTL